MGDMIVIGVLLTSLCIVIFAAAVLVHKANTERDAALCRVADARTEFLSRISYDIKTPMNVIVGTTALGMEETDNPEKMKECLGRIHMASEFLMGLLSDLVDMSKIEMGKFRLHERAYSFEEFMKEVRAIIEPACRKKQIQFHLPKDDININMMVDPIRFGQLFFNLLTNAVKFTPEGGEITFCICNYATHNNRFSADYVVSDNGIGMSQEFQKILFEPFTQEISAFAEKRNGAGLGLAITRNIVDLMGGTIDVKSELGIGTQIKVHLDIEIASMQPEKENEQMTMTQIRQILCEKRILVAEDHPLDIEITKRILENVGAMIVRVDDGKSALELFMEKEPYYFDAVLLDIRMSETDGLESIRGMRKVPHSDAQVIPVIAMSADDTIEDIYRCKEAGINALVAKPVEPQRLYQLLCEYLEAPI